MTTVAVTFSLTLTGSVGRFYAVSALVLGLAFVGQSFGLRRDPGPERAIKFFMFSNVYLMLVFAAVAIDALIA